MNKVKHLKHILMVMGVLVSLVVGATQASAQMPRDEVGIGFKEAGNKPKEKPIYDDTPTASKGKAINNHVRLPQTGELVKQLSLFMMGIVLIVLVFAFALDEQVKGSTYDSN